MLDKDFLKKILLDIAICVVAFILVVQLKVWALDSHDCKGYLIAATAISIAWVATYAIFRFTKKDQNFVTVRELLIVTATATIVFVLFSIAKHTGFFPEGVSTRLLKLFLFVVAGAKFALILLYRYYRYASNMDVEMPQIEPRSAIKPLKAAKRIDPDEFEDVKYAISAYTDEESLEFLMDNLDLGSSNTKIFASTTMFNFRTIRNYRYETIINIQKINSIRGIDELFNKINEKLPDEGICCICYESFEHLKDRINRSYPIVIRKFAQAYYFIVKRVVPKLFLTNRLYFDITKGRNRYFSNTEILGRLYYCGFEVVKEFHSDHLNWIIARRKQNPQTLVPKRYGPIIKLNRVCKNGEIKPIYKLRTMYPYSEYLQSYMYEKIGTDDIGKIKDDMRVTGWGRVFRKFWIDELPMIWNLIRGEIKIVGVRPVSMANFKTYPEYLQEKRIKVKPGLIPPMYYDMPKTEQGFYDSEEKYIDSYLRSPITTDIKYLFGSLYNIIIKRARSH